MWSYCEGCSAVQRLFGSVTGFRLTSCRAELYRPTPHGQSDSLRTRKKRHERSREVSLSQYSERQATLFNAVLCRIQQSLCAQISINKQSFDVSQLNSVRFISLWVHRSTILILAAPNRHYWCAYQIQRLLLTPILCLISCLRFLFYLMPSLSCLYLLNECYGMWFCLCLPTVTFLSSSVSSFMEYLIIAT